VRWAISGRNVAVVIRKEMNMAVENLAIVEVCSMVGMTKDMCVSGCKDKNGTMRSCEAYHDIHCEDGIA
jgi:hypothetical protein